MNDHCGWLTSRAKIRLLHNVLHIRWLGAQPSQQKQPEPTTMKAK